MKTWVCLKYFVHDCKYQVTRKFKSGLILNSFVLTWTIVYQTPVPLKTLNRIALNNTYFFIFSSGTKYLLLSCEYYMKTKKTSIQIFHWIFMLCCWVQEYRIVKMTYLYPLRERADTITFLKASTDIKIKTWHLVEEFLLGNCEY